MFGWGWLLLWVVFMVLVWGAFSLWSPASYGARRAYGYYDEPWRYGTWGGASGYHGSLWPWRSRVSQRGKGPVGYKRSDSRIAEDVSDALTMNDELDATGITVGVQNAVVTLSGRVPNRSDKRLAEVLADSVPGVDDVRNEIRIGAEPPPPVEPQPRSQPSAGEEGRQTPA